MNETMAVTGNDVRSLRGLALVRDKGTRIKHVAGTAYLVPSQSSKTGGYLVNLSENTCTCPDFEERQSRCKHQWALLILRHEVTVPEDTTVEHKITYRQNWPAYNKAQTTEKDRVRVLLRGLCDGIKQPAQENGRPRHLLADVVFAATMKVYTTVSGRRAMVDIRECQARGLMEKAPTHNTIFRYTEGPSLRPLLKTLVEESAAPLRALETQFAADATGFSTCNFTRWYDHKYGKEKRVREWVKAHAMVGTTTNVITAVEVTDGHANDSPEFKGLLDTTVAKGWNTREVSGDKAYLSNDNLVAIEAAGANPYIPFKVNSQPTGNTEAWQRLWHYFELNKRDFLDHYHRRSNVESTFSALKRKFGASLRCRGPEAQYNEVLLKCLAFNLTMVVHATYEFDLDPKFWMPMNGGVK